MFNNPNYTNKQPRNIEGKNSKSNKFDIRNGRFEQYLGKGKEPETANYVTGKLKRIVIRTLQKGQEKLNFLDIVLERNGQEINVSCYHPSSVSSELVSKLANVRNPQSELKLSVWQSGKYVNCAVWEKGHTVAHSNLPRVSKTKSGGAIQVDTSARDAVVLDYVKKINRRLGVSA